MNRPTPRRRRLTPAGPWHRRGATSVEYMIALILVALVVLSVWRLFGETVEQKFRAGEAKVRTLDGTAQEQAWADNLEDDNVFNTAEGHGGDGSGAPPQEKATKVGGSEKGAFASRELNSPSLEEGGSKDPQGPAAASGHPASGGGAVDDAREGGGGAGGREGKGLQKGRRLGQGAGGYVAEAEDGGERVGFHPLTLILLALVVVGLMILLFRGKRKDGESSEPANSGGGDLPLV